MIEVDLEQGTLTERTRGCARTMSLGTPEAFSLLSEAWLRCGWDNKHVYSFTWLGRPILQLPEDMFRIQEVVYRLRPDVIIETGIAHGGGLVFYASLCRAMGQGRVIGVDIEIRAHNRAAIESHELIDLITMFEGSSIDPNIVECVASELAPGERVLVVLDSNHTRAHVLAELRAYSRFVPVGLYIVAADGIMESLVGAPRAKPDWSWDNPKEAVSDFLRENPRFELSPPGFLFNEGTVAAPVTYWQSGWLRRVS